MFLEIPFGKECCPARKMVDLLTVLCCTLYLKSAYIKKSYKRVTGVRTILCYSKLLIRANF